jgi:predicted dehydrogenase
MKVGIIGCGSIARVQLPLIAGLKGAQIVGLADREIDRARHYGNQLDVKGVYDDGAAMIEAEKPDVVHILVQPQAHAEVSIMAMEHGCNVFVEKPMALNLADAKRMVDTADRNNVLLCVNHNAVVDDVFERGINLARSGAIGDIVSIDAFEVYDVSRKPVIVEEGAEHSHWIYKMPGGPIGDMLPHPLSLVMELMPEVVEVQTLGLNRGVFPDGWDDEMRITLRSNQITGYISLSLSERPDVGALVIKGTEGLIHADCYNFILTVRKQHSRLPRKLRRGFSGLQLGWQYFTGTVANVWKTAVGRIDKSYGTETNIQRFYESIRTGGDPPISIENCLRVVEMTDRIWSTQREASPCMDTTPAARS